MEGRAATTRKHARKMADIWPRVYRDNAALGQRVWPRQIDSARPARFCALCFVTANSMAAILVTAFHPSQLSHSARAPINRPSDKAVASQPRSLRDDTLPIVILSVNRLEPRVTRPLVPRSSMPGHRDDIASARFFWNTRSLFVSIRVSGTIWPIVFPALAFPPESDTFPDVHGLRNATAIDSVPRREAYLCCPF